MDSLPVSGVTYKGPPVDHRGILRKYSLPVGKSESLRAMQSEYMFFTPALLYLHGGFTDALWVEYMHLMQQDVKLHFRRFDSPIFRGLTHRHDRDWNHVVWAVHSEFWQSLADFLCTATLADRERHTVVRYGLQEFSVADPLAVDRGCIVGPTTPVLTMFAFGIYGNREKIAFDFAANPFLRLPHVVRLPADSDMQVFADAFFTGQNPLLAQDAFNNPQFWESSQ